MLQQLSINNYAIIDQLSLKPDAHLNIVTGETGAGKSIILGALSLILGDRADTSVLINKEQKCVVEAHFDVKDHPAFRAAMQAAELDDDTQCIIRREISSAGKSRAFINDTPVTLAVLHSLTSLLVDLHQQFDTHALEDDHFQLDVLDALGFSMDLRQEYAAIYRKYEQVTGQLQVMRQEQARWQKEADYRQFLLDELEQAAFREEEIENAEQQLKQLNAAERIITVLQGARFVLDESEQPLAAELRKISQQLQGIGDVLPESVSLQERLASVYAEVKDIASELERLETKVSLDPKQLQQLQERVDTGLRLLKKHGLMTTAELLQLQAQLRTELNASLDLDEQMSALDTQQQLLFEELRAKGKALSEARLRVAPGTAEEITALLADVGMPNARFTIRLSAAAQPMASGMDKVAFLLDANKSGNAQPIQKAASGGELSRIALCIKSLIAKAVHLPTLIFDEVDTGISGEAARKVGGLLKELARFHQVICITHQPQVAAKGSTHFYVFKEQGNDGRINTQLRVLPENERVLAIARMIGGDQPSEAAMNNARELTAS